MIYFGFFSGVEWGNGVLSSIVDDMMIFCDADARQLGYLRCILGCFEAVSGLKINLSKRKFSSWGRM